MKRSPAHNIAILAIAALFLTGSVNGEILAYAGGGSPAGIYRIDQTTGRATFVTVVQPTLASGGLAYFNQKLYATDYTPNVGTVPPTIYGIVHLESGKFTEVGSQGLSANWFGLTSDPSAGILYVAELEDNTLKSFTPGGPIKTIGPITGILNSGGVQGMAYDPTSGILYATDYYAPSPNLYRINLKTGAATLVGPLGFPANLGGGAVPLAYDPITKTLYAADDVSRSLYTIDKQTGLATLVGALGSLVQPMGSMTWVTEPADDTLASSSYFFPMAAFVVLIAVAFGSIKTALGRQGLRRYLPIREHSQPG